MRSTLRHIGLVAALAVARAAMAQDVPPPPNRLPTADNPKTDLDKIGDTMENVATKPLKDLNIIQARVDPEIERIMEDPYSLKGIRTCAQYKAEVEKLTRVLGPDVDAPEFKRKAKTPAEQALSLGESAAGSLIPFSGIIRRLSGAQAKQDFAKAAIYAGSMRRSYLKGNARNKGCKV